MLLLQISYEEQTQIIHHITNSNLVPFNVHPTIASTYLEIFRVFMISLHPLIDSRYRRVIRLNVN